MNSRSNSSQLTSDAQSIYSLRTGSTLKNYYTNSNFMDNLGDLDCLSNDDLNKKWSKDKCANLCPIKLNNQSPTSF